MLFMKAKMFGTKSAMPLSSSNSDYLPIYEAYSACSRTYPISVLSRNISSFHKNVPNYPVLFVCIGVPKCPTIHLVISEQTNKDNILTCNYEFKGKGNCAFLYGRDCSQKSTCTTSNITTDPYPARRQKSQNRGDPT